MDIDWRLLAADKRQCIGDYEGDTVVGKGHKGVLVTLVDRATREKIRALKNRNAERASDARIAMLRAEKPLNITFGNGKGFAHHEKMAAVLDTAIYFAKPYRSWERGTNENTNGLIRQFLPKWATLEEVSNKTI